LPDFEDKFSFPDNRNVHNNRTLSDFNTVSAYFAGLAFFVVKNRFEKLYCLRLVCTIAKLPTDSLTDKYGQSRIQTQEQLEIWGKAQRESTWRYKFHWGVNLGGWNLPGSKVKWPEVKCISIHRMCIVDLEWLDICACKFFVSRLKFTKFFCRIPQGSTTIKFVSDFWYLSRFLSRLWSKSRLCKMRQILKFLPSHIFGVGPSPQKFGRKHMVTYS